MPFNMQGWEWVILIVLALLIFGGTRLAGAGKNAGRALREFKDETRQIKADDEKAKREKAERDALSQGTPNAPVVDEVVEAEVVEQPEKRDQA
ncbi:Sec-independent protein translocase TatA [Propioniciclava coleopterorum]|uniref:Sec-independent protein translocase protein TatA n=1 Tax=Propioniciclava coleopterorum TaxID=2714937 RepID=A0A6G7Y972_9ACTN|nr:twin-arginine translocase TatA/TatE family subunit [Propioniciclava coleopterorum]QIK73343.1 Sec-independent protein translocase TatA [Propioniciclava coleopterorum]